MLYIFFLLRSGYFAACETAYTAVSKVRLRTMTDRQQAGKKALGGCDRFGKALTTILIGNNIFHASCGTCRWSRSTSPNPCGSMTSWTKTTASPACWSRNTTWPSWRKSE